MPDRENPALADRIAEITVRVATYPTVTVSYDDLAAAWRKDQGIPDYPGGDDDYPDPEQLQDREWFTGPLDDLLTPLLGDTGHAELRVESVTIMTAAASAPAGSPAVVLAPNHWAAALEDPAPVTAGPFPRPAPDGRYPGAHCACCGAWYLAGHAARCWVAVADALDEAGKFSDARPGDYAEACRQLTVLRKLAAAVRASGLGDAPAATGETSDACADAMTALHNEILSMTPAGQREHAEDLLCDLMDLTGDNLSGPGQAEVISRALSSGADPAGSGDSQARALLAAAEILHDRGAPAETVNMLKMYAGLGKPAAADDEHVRRIGHFTDAGRRPVEIGVDHALMTYSISGVTARFSREQRFTLHALETAATVAIDTYESTLGDPDDDN